MRNLLYILPFVFILSTSSLVDAQNNFFIAYEAHVDFRYRLISNQDFSADFVNYFRENRKSDRGQTHIGGSIKFGYQINPTISVISGVAYNQMGYKFNTAPFTNPLEVPAIQSLNIESASIPILLQYNMYQNQKSSIFLEGGLLHSFIINYGISSEVNGRNIQSFINHTVSEYKLGGSIGLGYSYELTNRLILTVKPVFQYFIHRDQHYFINENLYGTSLQMGLRQSL